MFICHEKVILEGLKPFGNSEVINLSEFSYLLIIILHCYYFQCMVFLFFW